MKTGKIKSFFPGKKSKTKKRLTFSYNLPYENHEKKSSYEVEVIIVFGRSTQHTINFLWEHVLRQWDRFKMNCKQEFLGMLYTLVRQESCTVHTYGAGSANLAQMVSNNRNWSNSTKNMVN